jgi:hypothetical protein
MVQAELLSLLADLCSLARESGDLDQEQFFGRIRAGIEHAREADDLAEPFMELSTSAFRGFHYSAPAHHLLDRVLAVAQTFSLTCSADADTPH